MGKLKKLFYVILGILLLFFAAICVDIAYGEYLPINFILKKYLIFYGFPIGILLTFLLGAYFLLRGLFSRRRHHGITNIREDGAVYVTEKAICHAIRAAVETDSNDVVDTRVKVRIKNRKGQVEYSAKVNIKLETGAQSLDERGSYLREKIAGDLLKMIGHPMKRVDIIFHLAKQKREKGEDI